MTQLFLESLVLKEVAIAAVLAEGDGGRDGEANSSVSRVALKTVNNPCFYFLCTAAKANVGNSHAQTMKIYETAELM
jgi:hypothetical protein